MTAIQTEPAAGVRQSRLPSLTGLRFIAASLVFFFHVDDPALFSDKAAGSVYTHIFDQGGWTGVGFFFILSGFVLTWSARADDTARRFWRRRFFKIYPNHLATFVFALLALWVSGMGTKLGNAILNLFLLQAWSPDLHTEASVNPVAWSLSVEAFFYLSFPFVVKLVRRIAPERLWFTAIGIMAVIWVVPLVAQLLPGEPHVFLGPISEWRYWLIYMLPLTRFLEFLLGMVMARIVLTGRWIRLPVVPALLFSVAGYVLPSLLPWSFRLVACTAIPLALLIPAVATADVAGRWTPFRNAFAVWLGNMSFALYLLHPWFVTLLYRWLGGGNWSTPVAIAALVFLMTATLAVSWLLYSLVEHPIMKRWSSPRPRASGRGPRLRRGDPAGSAAV